MKIAYLIVAHGNYLHLERLIKALHEDDCMFYIHIDKQSPLPDIKGENIIFLSERVRVKWSGFSLVQAAINLLRRAFEDGCDYYALISGADYPIKPNSYLRELLQHGGEYIHIQKIGTDPYAPLSRYKYYYFTDFYNRRNKNSIKTKFFLALQKKLRKLKIKKQIPFQLYTGGQWFVLSKECVAYILNEIKRNKKYKRFFLFGFCSDESFFQTIIGNSEFHNRVKKYLTYTDWSVSPAPAMIGKHHLPVLKASDKFFARKFDDNSADIIDAIDKELRTDKNSSIENQKEEQTVSTNFRYRK